MITKITMRGIKGANAKQTLTGRDIIIGSNGAGKTTRTQSLGLALLGYIPGKGKQPAETMKLASGNALEVGFETSDVKNVSRKFSRKDTTITQTITIAPKGSEKTAAQKEQRLEHEFGKAPVMLDFSEFLGLSDMKRREFIFSLVNQDSEKFDATTMYKAILAIAAFSEDEDADPQAVEALHADIDECLTNAPQVGDCETYQGLLTAMLIYAKEQLSHWKKERDKSEGAAQKIAEYKNDLEQTDRNLDANRKKHEALSEERLTASNELTRVQSENRQRELNNQKITSRKKAIVEAEASDTAKNAAAINEMIADYKRELVQVDNKAAIAHEAERLETINKNIASFENLRVVLLEQHQAAKSQRDANEKLINSLKNQSGTCPVDKRIQCGQDFTELMMELGLEAQQHTATIREITEKGTSNNANLENEKRAAQECQAKIDGLRQQEINALRANEEVQQVIRDLEADLKKPENDDTAMAAWLTSQKEELKSLLPTEGAEEWPLLPTVALDNRIKELETEITVLKSTVDEQTKVRNTLANLKSSMVDGTVAGYHVEAWKRISEAVGPKGLQGELVKDALAPLKECVQTKLSAMGVNRFFYIQTEDEKGKEIFQFGYVDHDRQERHNFDALSTGEQMILLIAFMTTIVEQLNPPLKILAIDNMEALDRENLMNVLKGLEVAGESFDNIILSGVLEIEAGDALCAGSGWHVWNLDGGAA